ncbi:TetR/AcrR family transcriptional regulator [Ruania halotolerans]|uniref:TetR/AcrR family transcriptional regulator n=1 Tax=Ruania halotolerans TaxID=2897773 RepID=UPI001E3D3325|nr:TetR/AcrR family transcriptional regulator [Ruania halotolerans]UFU07888.1 TetR/AcrR family transcriptional regulator [Ruania halotolerans]
MSPYHHGDLRRAVLDAAIDAIGDHGPAGISIRDLARRAGVSHAGPVHHFGDKAGVLTALAAEGFELLADALAAADADTQDFVEVGVAYVRFAMDHPAHFVVMFSPGLYRSDDATLLTARARAGSLLTSGAAAVSDDDMAGVAAWSLMHGFANLYLTGALRAEQLEDPDTAARAIARLLFH